NTAPPPQPAAARLHTRRPKPRTPTPSPPRPDRLPPDYLQPLVNALAAPATLAGIRSAELQPVAYQLALYFGVRRDPDTAAALGGVYERLGEDLTADGRGALVDGRAAPQRGGAAPGPPLLPVLQRATDATASRGATRA